MRPFENRSHDSLDRYLAATMRDELVSELAGSGAVRVIDGPSPTDAFVVDGSVTRSGAALTVRARLLRRQTREVVWTARIERDVRGPDLPRELAAGILRALSVRPATRADARVVTQAAYDAYLRGRYHLPRRTQADVTLAIRAFQDAIGVDPEYAAAWSGLAIAYLSAHTWGFAVDGQESALTRARGASENAIRLDSAAAAGWALRALVAREVDPASRDAVRPALQRAAALDPLRAQTWQSIATMWADLGEPDSALVAMRRSVSLEPLNGLHLAWMSQHFYWRRTYDSAAAYADSAVVADPTLPYAHEVAGFAEQGLGRFARARSHFQAARRLSSGAEVVRALEGLAHVAAALGDSAGARAIAEEAERAVQPGRLTAHAAVSLGSAWIAGGDQSRALRWLERYETADDLHFLLHLRRDGGFDPVRSEPRFQRLAASSN